MKLHSIISGFFLIILFSCQNSIDPLNIVIWGEKSNGLQLSISIDDNRLTEVESGTVILIVKNVTDKEIANELYATLNLYDEGNILRYISYFDLMAKDITSLYESSRAHPKSNFQINSNSQRKYEIDITKLGWIQPQDSRPPYAEFYDLILKSRYRLVSELHFIFKGEVHSNSIQIEID
jgi:hypothetical protein